MRDPNDTRDIGPRIGSPLWNYITAVTVAGLAALLVAVRGLPGSGPARCWGTRCCGWSPPWPSWVSSSAS